MKEYVKFRYFVATNVALIELGKLIDMKENNMARFYSPSICKGELKVWFTYIDHRLHEIRQEMDELTDEKNALEWLHKSLNPCCKCNGFGGWRIQVDMDESIPHKCDRCNGTGLEPKE
jgi:hypothetical protein